MPRLQYLLTLNVPDDAPSEYLTEVKESLSQWAGHYDGSCEPYTDESSEKDAYGNLYHRKHHGTETREKDAYGNYYDPNKRSSATGHDAYGNPYEPGPVKKRGRGKDYDSYGNPHSPVAATPVKAESKQPTVDLDTLDKKSAKAEKAKESNVDKARGL